MNQTVKKIWNAVSTVLIVIVVAVALLLVSFRLIGLQGFTVLSGSMEPAYHTGSVIYVKPVDAETLEEGQVVTFYLSGKTVATHRIIEVVEENGSVSYRTKGDANDVADGSLLNPKNVIGTPVFSIPYMGYALSYIQSPPGMYVAIAVGAALMLLIVLPSLLFDKGNDQKTKNKEEQT
jgi:signal peptidase